MADTKIKTVPFGITENGESVQQWTLSSESGVEVDVLDYGVTLRAIRVPDRRGQIVDVLLGFDTLEEYETKPGSHGATIGRFANRIRGAAFTLDGEEYRLAANEGENHLHGGLRGFDRYLWDAEELSDGVRFSRCSPHGEEGYPGNLRVEVTVTLCGRELALTYRAVCDRDTILNLTNHSYFKLVGAGTIDEHCLRIDAEHVVAVDERNIPTGELPDVGETKWDFRESRRLGRVPYDTCYILRPSGQMELRSEKSGIVMRVATDQPGVQIFTADTLPRQEGKGGAVYEKRCGICFETQHYPDSIHHAEWPSPILRVGERFESRTSFCYDVM